MSSSRSDNITHSFCPSVRPFVRHAFSPLKHLKQMLMFNVFSVVEEEAADDSDVEPEDGESH